MTQSSLSLTGEGMGSERHPENVGSVARRYIRHTTQFNH